MGRDLGVKLVVGKTQMGRVFSLLAHSGADIHIFQVYTMLNGL